MSVPTYDLAALKTKYGDFAIEAESGAEGNVSYDSTNNVYTIAVAATKYKYTLTGYFSGKILIDNTNSLESFKGVKLSLAGACLVNEGNDSPIDYDLSNKNVEISAKNGTENLILSYGEGPCIHSENNVEISGKGTLEMSSLYYDTHVIDAEGDITVYESLTINVPYCGHDVFHGENFISVDDDGTAYSGTMNIANVVSQAFDFETDAVDATITVSGGTINIDTAASAFKTDVSLLIEAGATVNANNLLEGAIAASDGSSGVSVTVNGTFLVDGEAYNS